MSATSAVVQLGRQLADIAGSDHVCDDPALLTPFAVDGVRPQVSVAPASADEVAAIVRIANAQKLNLIASGGFTAQSLGRTPSQIDILLRTERMNQVLHYDPGDLTIGVAAGMRVGQVQRTVAANNLILPLDVPRPAQSTIGGALATASSGPLKHGYGGAQEYCIGVTFVTGDGRIAKAGGRVVKNVAGYDLMKLLIGSQGTLGVIVSANFKLFTAPRQTRTFLAAFGKLEDALTFRRRVQRSPLAPMCVELISPLAHAYLGSEVGDVWTVAVRASGSEPVLARYRQELGSAVTNEITNTQESTFWSAAQDFAENVGAQHHNAMSMSMHLPSSALEAALATSQKIAADHNFVFACIGRVALASMSVVFIPFTVDPPSVTQYANAVSALRGAMPSDSGLVLHRCPREVKNHIDVWGSSTNDLEAMRAVKKALDPIGVLNRGRFLF